MSLSVEKIVKMAEAIELGYSRAQIAKYAGVSEKTAAEYRIYGEETMPKNCGCGRPLKHTGNCRWRRTRAQRMAAIAGYANTIYDESRDYR